MRMFKSLAATLALASAASVVAVAVQSAAPRKITVEAERFSFFPSRIRVRVGEAIELHLRSADTSHGFTVEGTDIDVEIPKRGQGEVVVQYTPTREGRFRFECDRMCGAGHHFMRGEIVVLAKE
jgi:cytochrome c oxidase subunit 2